MIQFMRLLVLFDLPVTSKSQRKAASKFRRFLLNDGFYMMQFSVYCRICNGYDSINMHEKLVQNNLPSSGAVRTLIVTEKQYENMGILIGGPTPEEEKFEEDQISFF